MSRRSLVHRAELFPDIPGPLLELRRAETCRHEFYRRAAKIAEEWEEIFHKSPPEREFKIGIRKYRAAVADGYKPYPMFEADQLFNNDPFREWEAYLTERGFDFDIVNLSPAEVDNQISEIVGAETSAEDAANVNQSLAWALTAYVYIEYMLRRAILNKNTRSIERNAYLKGRLAEWWINRSDGFETMALSRLNSSSALAGRNGDGRISHNRKRIESASRWTAAASEHALSQWQRNPKLSASAVAQRVRKMLAKQGIVSADGQEPPSVDRIRKVIQPLRPD